MSNPITDLIELPIVPYVDINHAATAYGRIWYEKYGWPMWVIGTAIFVIVVMSLFSFGFSEGWCWFAGLSLGGYGLGVYGIIYSGGRAYFFKSIAKDWGWTYTPEVRASVLHTSLLRVGHTHRFIDVLEGTWQNHKALVGSFTYTIGYGKHSHTYGGALAKVETAIALPHLLFAVTRDIYDNHIVRATNLVSVPIEQLLSGRRGLYAEKKLEIEALQLFTPARVGEIELKWPDYSFEILGNEIYAYGSSTLTSRAQIQDLFALIQYIIRHIVPTLQRMEGSVKAMREVLGPKGRI